jgi:hypothetical protein
MSMSNTAPARVASATKRNQALELRIQGLTLSAIGEKLGISKSRAYQYVSEGLAKLNQVAVVEAEQLRRLTSEQLDQLLAAHMPKALAGDTKAAGVVLRCLDSRIKLFALVQSQPVAEADEPYKKLPPEELKALAKKLGIWREPSDEPASYAAVPATSMNGHSPSGRSF